MRVSRYLKAAKARAQRQAAMRMMPTYGPAMSAKSRSATTGGSAAEWCVVSDVRGAQFCARRPRARAAARRTEEVDGEQHVERGHPEDDEHGKLLLGDVEDRHLADALLQRRSGCGGGTGGW